MIKITHQCCLLILLTTAFTLSVHANDTIVVFTTHDYPSDYHQVIYLDKAQMLEDHLFANLSDKPEIAEQQALAIIHAADFQQKQSQLIHAYHDLLKAYALGLTKVPAVVFNERDVIYGTTDVSLAIKLRGQTP